MDDRELEARLATRLHARFDDAIAPPGLASSVGQALATSARRVSFDLGVRRFGLGWPVVALAALVAIVVVIAGNIGGPFGPGNRPSPSPSPSAAAERHFIVLPPGGTVLSKPEASLAGDVLSARIRALGIGTFSSGTGYGIGFRLPAAGPSDTSIRAVLSATGDIRIVLLPADDYGPGKLIAKLGAPLPKDEPALFGWDGIDSIVTVAFDGAPLIAMTPKGPAVQAFADYASAHRGETYAVVLDGVVVLLPTAEGAVTDGSINLSNGQIPGGDEPSPAYFETAAILAGGMLPEAWRGASVPEILAREEAIQAVVGGFPDANVESVDLDAVADSDGWRAVWGIVLTGNVGSFKAACGTQDPAEYVCLRTAASARIVIDAISGDIVSIEAPAP